MENLDIRFNKDGQDILSTEELKQSLNIVVSEFHRLFLNGYSDSNIGLAVNKRENEYLELELESDGIGTRLRTSESVYNEFIVPMIEFIIIDNKVGLVSKKGRNGDNYIVDKVSGTVQELPIGIYTGMRSHAGNLKVSIMNFFKLLGKPSDNISLSNPHILDPYIIDSESYDALVTDFVLGEKVKKRAKQRSLQDEIDSLKAINAQLEQQVQKYEAQINAKEKMHIETKNNK